MLHTHLRYYFDGIVQKTNKPLTEHTMNMIKDLIPQTPVYAHWAKTMMLTYIDI